MTKTLVIICFQVWGIWEMWGQIFPIVRGNWENNAKWELSLQISSWEAFLPFIPPKSKRFVLLENNYRDCLQELWTLKAVRRPGNPCDGPLPSHFLCLLSIFWPLSAKRQPNYSCLVMAAGSKASSPKWF